MTREQEAEILKQQAEHLTKVQESIGKRIQELEAAETSEKE